MSRAFFYRRWRVAARHKSLIEHPAIRSYQNDGAFPHETSLFAYRKV